MKQRDNFQVHFYLISMNAYEIEQSLQDKSLDQKVAFKTEKKILANNKKTCDRLQVVAVSLSHVSLIVHSR